MNAAQIAISMCVIASSQVGSYSSQA